MPVFGDRPDSVVRVYTIRGLEDSGSGEMTGAQLMLAIANAMGVNITPIGTTMFMARATAAEHDAIVDLIAQLKKSTAIRYRIELTQVTVTGQAPAIGTGLTTIPSPEARMDRIVAQGTATRFDALRTQSYIGEWWPIVGNGVVGTQPQVKTAWSGLATTVSVGDTDGKSVQVHLNGDVSRVALKDGSHAIGSGGASLTITLPSREERTLHANMKIPLGQSTIIGVVNGFDAGTWIVILAKVDRVE